MPPWRPCRDQCDRVVVVVHYCNSDDDASEHDGPDANDAMSMRVAVEDIRYDAMAVAETDTGDYCCARDAVAVVMDNRSTTDGTIHTVAVDVVVHVDSDVTTTSAPHRSRYTNYCCDDAIR